MKNITLALIFIFLTSCSCYKIYRETSLTEEGLRFTKSSPFLLVTQNDEGKTQFQVIYLPDTQRYVIKKKGFLGTAELSATLENGWNLTSINSKSDSQVAETITALASLIPSIKATPADSTKKEGRPRLDCPYPCLYKYDPTSNSLRLVTR
jgi:hypothetical protein